MAESIPIIYREPCDSEIQCVVALTKGASEAFVFPSATMGLIARSSAHKAVAVGWEAIVYHLEWGMSRSPKMLADVKAMITRIEAKGGR